MNTSLVFMAAGFGTRFGGGVKQLEPVGPNGEVLMDYAVYDGLQAGFDRVVFIIRKDLEADFRAGVGRRTEAKCDVHYVIQDMEDLPKGFTAKGRQKPWGTSHAVLACRDVVREPFCVLNADDFYGRETFQKIHDWMVAPGHEALDLCMAGYVLGNTLSESGAVTRGLCRVNEQGELQAIQETRGIVLDGGRPCVHTEGSMRELNPASTVSMNIWGLTPAFMQYLEAGFERFLRGLSEEDLNSEYLLPVAVGDMIRKGQGRVQVLPTAEHWFGMTYAADKLQTRQKIQALIEQGTYPSKI